jgi:putative ABC transport system permease protein
MRSGLTWQALRKHRWGFVGPSATQCVAAAVITAMTTTGMSLSSADLSPAERSALDASDMGSATAAFTGTSIYLSILMVGVTMTAAITRQARDIALLRAVGATPGRIRRSVARQAALIAVPSATLGYGLGLLLGRVWLAQLVSHDVVPAAVGYRPVWWVLPLVIGIEVVTSVVGALVSAVRPARVRPATALTETATRRPGGGPVRTVLGAVLLVAGVVLSVVLSGVDVEQADAGGLFVILGMSVGVGMLGPVLLLVAARLARPVLRLVGGRRGPRGVASWAGRAADIGVLAADAMVARSRALSTALIPLVLAGSFAAVKVGAYGTAERATGVRPAAADMWLEYSGTAIFVAFAVIGAVNTLMTVSVGRERELGLMRLAGATRARVLAVWACEAGLVLGTVVVLAAGVAFATLAPMTHTAFGALPYIPPAQLVVGLVAGAVVVAAGTVLPAVVLTRRPPIESVRVQM